MFRVNWLVGAHLDVLNHGATVTKIIIVVRDDVRVFDEQLRETVPDLARSRFLDSLSNGSAFRCRAWLRSQRSRVRPEDGFDVLPRNLISGGDRHGGDVVREDLFGGCEDGAAGEESVLVVAGWVYDVQMDVTFSVCFGQRRH